LVILSSLPQFSIRYSWSTATIYYKGYVCFVTDLRWAIIWYVDRSFCSTWLFISLKLVKFKAKLLLLERGLLEAAQEIDTISPEASAEVPHERDEDEDGDDLDEKSDIAFEKTIMDYVWSELKKAPKIGRDYYKNTLVYDARKKVISEFLKATALKQCKKLGCGA
jgi:DNA-directed RNA polymerase I subunit RPA1